MTSEPLPYLSQAMEHLDGLNGFLRKGVLRRFQHQMATFGHFEVISPLDGQKTRAAAVYIAPHTGALYWFEGTECFFLLVGSLRLGYPILAIIHDTEIHWLIENNEAQILLDVALSMAQTNTPPTRRIQDAPTTDVVIGHQNFAHFVWNEFPALFHLIQDAPHIEIRAKYDAFQILPTLGKSANIPVIYEETLAAGWCSKLSTFVGSIRCDAPSKAYLMNILDQRSPGRDIEQPFVYLTIRNMGRTVQDQDLFLAELIQSILAESDDIKCVVDGFLVPDDFDRSLYGILRAPFDTRTTEAQEIVKKIRNRLTQSESARVIDITGMALSSAIRIIRDASFYVAHAGTTQHKAGWFYPVHGLVHGNQASISAGSLKWTASMMHGAIVPLGSDSENIIDLDVQNLPNKNPRNCDYAFIDIHEAVRDIMTQMRPYLPK